jgi:hypothetical protein
MPFQFEAWLRQSGDILPDRGLLITLDQHIMSSVAKIFKEKVFPLSKEKSEAILPRLASRQSDFTLTYHPILRRTGILTQIMS